MLLIIHSNTKAQVIPVLASNVAYANITCVVVSPIVITKLRDMHFGNIVSGSKGTIMLPSDGGKPISTGSAGIPSTANTTSTATFEVSDNLGNNPNAVHMFTEYTITLPTNDVVLVNEDGKTMRVGNFNSNPASTQKGTLVNGIGQLSVGATLYFEADQGLGQYASASPFPVTVNFN
ncbi:MAG: DUF4402 domain-containing protein [Bacteroidia bacterium]|nr:DUF4402 domain-containing protein [Bacteroidia bacterium]